MKGLEENCSLLAVKNCSHVLTPEAKNGQNGQSSENTVQLQVRMELEHERRLRTQADLDESEKKHVILKRELNTQSRRNEDLAKQLQETKEKCEVRIKQVKVLYFIYFSKSHLFTIS